MSKKTVDTGPHPFPCEAGEKKKDLLKTNIYATEKWTYSEYDF